MMGSLRAPHGGRAFGILWAMVVLSALGSGGLGAQDEPQPILTAQFSFSNPGARSLGLGGAFVASADDATAAWANPAGLVQIARPEVSIEGRHWRYSIPFTVGGRVSGDPSGLGLDTVAGLRSERSDSDVTEVAFLSFVYPRERWALALYRHVFANLDSRGQTEGLFGGGTDCCQYRFLDQRNRSNVDMVSYGLSAAYRINDSFSLGLGLVYYQIRAEVQSDLYLWDDLDYIIGSGTSYLPERFAFGQTLEMDDWSMDLSAGLLWKIDRHWSLGARYREGPSAPMSGRALIGPALDLGLPAGTVIDLGFSEVVDFPDNYGLGVAYRSADGRLMIGFEWDRVTYSDPLESLEIEDQLIDDADELRLGSEWAFVQSTPLVALRAGLWLDPDHQTRANERANDFTRALLQAGEDELHLSLGLGAAFESFQIDGAVDLSESVKTLSISAIYSF